MVTQSRSSRFLRTASILAAATALASCDTLGITGDDDLLVAISPRSLTLEVGDTATVTWSLRAHEAGSVFSRLTSESPGVADVILPDRIVAKRVGSTHIVLRAWTEDGASGSDRIPVQVH